MLNLGLDCGGSINRWGATLDDIKERDSHLTLVDSRQSVRDDVSDPTDLFEIQASAYPAISGKRYAHGEVQNFLIGSLVVCTNDDKKTEQDITYVNAIYSVAKYLYEHKVFTNTEVVVAACIPTAEFYSAIKDYASIFKKRLLGLHTVYFPLVKKTVVFKIVDCKVCPEGVVAAMPVLKKSGNYKNSIVAIVDVGSRSSDITILDRLKPIGRGAISCSLSGTNFEAAIMSNLDRENIPYNRGRIEDMIKRGYVMHGSNKVDIRAYIKDAKEMFASALYEQLRNCANTCMLNVQSIEAIVPIGRLFSRADDASGDMYKIFKSAVPFETNIIALDNPGRANINEIVRKITA